MRISRPCYDKYWRCPGWAGGGMKYAKVNRCENGGSLAQVINYNGRWKWKFHQCPECDIWVLPYYSQYLSLFELWDYFMQPIRDYLYDRKQNKRK